MGREGAIILNQIILSQAKDNGDLDFLEAMDVVRRCQLWNIFEVQPSRFADGLISFVLLKQ